jgi:putative oxidoreductase
MTERDSSSNFKAESTAVTLLRLGVGIIFVVHGWGKLMDIPGTVQGFAQLGIPEPDKLVYLAIAGEFAGGIGLFVGLFTRIAALGPLCSMLVAIAAAHLHHGLLAKNGGFEYPLVLALVSLFFVTYGAGPFSLDALSESERSPRQRFRGHRVPSYS